MKKVALISIFCCFFSFISLTQERTVIICGNLIDGNSDEITSNKVIIVEGERIVAIGTKENISSNDKVIDLSQYTVLPGLIDMHVHPNLSVEDYQINHLKGTSAYKALFGLKAVQELLKEGWTTLRVAGDGDIGYANMELKYVIDKGMFQGPRIFGAAHYLSVTGGGGDINFISYEQEIIADGLVVNGPEEVRKAVRNEIKYGSDWIKLLVTGAFMSAGDNPNNVHFSPEELQMAVDEAKRRSVPVMAHAHAAEGIKMATKAGVRTIEHGSFIDEEAMDLMIKHNTYLIPTLSVGKFFENTEDEYLQKASEISRRTREVMYKNFELARKKGVKFGLGSDFVGWPASYSATEFIEYLKLGFTPMQTIKCATKANSEILMKEKEIGTIEAGKYADIIATKGNPLEDISELQGIRFVMKGGELIKFEE